MGYNPLVEPLKNRVTWSDYRSWDDENRWEIIDGQPYAMTVPRVSHQAVCGELFALLHAHFKGRSCRPFISPIDVRLTEYDAVQPDLLVVCDESQITPTHIEGPPTLVVEVLSPSTQRHDRVRKLRLYAAAGVGEYWLIQPYPALAEVLSLENGSYLISGTYTEKDTLTSPSFPELALPLQEIFPLSDGETIDEVRETPPPYAIPG
ncbi:MAG: Uma2 family endonuclease [Candidatus Eremiobacteraeota bacterium]|nr:Uma2 family endonuclease [Candidatus Eremiobacteraeota bacterium]